MVSENPHLPYHNITTAYINTSLNATLLFIYWKILCNPNSPTLESTIFKLGCKTEEKITQTNNVKWDNDENGERMVEILKRERETEKIKQVGY